MTDNSQWQAMVNIRQWLMTSNGEMPDNDECQTMVKAWQ